MKKNIKIFLSLITLSMFSVITPVKADNFSGGDGSLNNPYIISNINDLQNVGNYCGEKYKDVYYKVVVKNNIIDAQNKRFKPICEMYDETDSEKQAQNAFYGHFEGNNVEITNLNIETNNISGGLFGAIKNAEVKNIGLGEKSTVNTYGKTKKTGISPTGGIIGQAWNSSISNVWNKADISSSGSRAGGVVGALINSSLKNAINFGDVYSGRDVDNNSEVGGIVGASFKSNIQNIVNYNTNISSNGKEDRSGLLVGYFNNKGEYSGNSIKNAYTIKVNTSLNGWGIVDGDSLVNENVKGFTEQELKSLENYVGFDFNNEWTMSGNYAILRNVKTDSSIKYNNETIKDNKKGDATIKFNGKTLDIENFIYGEGRTFVNLSEFCSVSKICKISYDSNEKEYIISKNIDVTGEKISSDVNSSEVEYTYLVYHSKGSKEFKPFILIGSRKIENDVASQKGDVASCPNDKTHVCDSNHFYVPLRFLTQALGLRIEWDGENSIVNIKDSFTNTFLSKYDIVTTTNQTCVSDECIVKSSSDNEIGSSSYTLVNKGKSYYMNVINKTTYKREDFYKLYAFYGDDFDISGEIGSPTSKSGYFTINKNKLTVNSKANSNSSSKVIAKNIAQIVVYEIKASDKDYNKEDANIGGYPIVVNNVFVCQNCK